MNSYSLLLLALAAVCISAQEKPTIHHRYVCRKNYPRQEPVSCQQTAKKVIKIHKATYGRQWSTPCKYAFPIRSRCTDIVTEGMKKVCDGKRICNPNDQKNQILDMHSCWGVDSASSRFYFEIFYECVDATPKPETKQKTFQRQICKKNRPKKPLLSCAQDDLYPNIVKASYGRHGPNAQKVCLTYRPWGYIPRCYEEVTTKVQDVCKGKKVCNPEAHKNAILGTTSFCLKRDGQTPYRQYYFEVDYKCSAQIAYCQDTNVETAKKATCQNGHALFIDNARLVAKLGQCTKNWANSSNYICEQDITSTIAKYFNGKQKIQDDIYDYFAYLCPSYKMLKLTYECQDAAQDNQDKDHFVYDDNLGYGSGGGPGPVTEEFSEKEIYCPAGEELNVSKASVRHFSDTDTQNAVCEEDATAFAKQIFDGQNKITASVDLFKHVHCHVQKGLMIDYSCQPDV
eukprot:TCONS_00018780-protein